MRRYLLASAEAGSMEQGSRAPSRRSRVLVRSNSFWRSTCSNPNWMAMESSTCCAKADHGCLISYCPIWDSLPQAANDRIWTPPHFASAPYSGAKVRLLTYIRPQCDLGHPRSGHDGLFARRLLIALPGFAPVVIPRLFRRRFDLFAITRDARNRGG